MAAELRALLCSLLLIVLVLQPCVFAEKKWKNARATYYGTPEGTIGGACGFEDHKEAYGPYTAALSTKMFRNAGRCGACYELRCANTSADSGCKSAGENPLVVTATDLCPPGSTGGWCDPPNKHFDLSQPAFLQIANALEVGVVPIQYRKISCKRNGGAQFTITGDTNFNLVTVTNVGGAGDIEKLEVKIDGEDKWTELKRNWGEKWETNEKLARESLTFKITTSDGRTLISHNVAPKSWQFGQTYHGQNL